MAAAIEIERVTKTFRLYHQKPSSLKERMLHVPPGPLGAVHRPRRHQPRHRGRAPPSVCSATTGRARARCSSAWPGSSSPPAGSVRTVGRMAALLELGAGFHPELSGRENVYLNGSILGLKRAEVDRVFDDIVGFAELEQFIDTPVKHYSSGMYVRLGFAVAINVDPGDPPRRRGPLGRRRGLPAQVHRQGQDRSRPRAGRSSSSPTPPTWSARCATRPPPSNTASSWPRATPTT